MAAKLNESVLKAFAILDLFGELRTELSATEIAKATGLNGVTVHRFLRSLEAAGALTCAKRGVYRLGYHLLDLGERVRRSNQLTATVQPLLNALTQDLRESSLATQFERDAAVCVAYAIADRPFTINVPLGKRLDAHASANGKLWLAHMPAEERARYFEQTELRAHSSRTVTAREALAAELETIRAQGFACNRGESEESLRAIAVPVLGPKGNMIAGISVFGPESRFDAAFQADALAKLRHTATALTHALYGDGKV